MLYLLHVMAVVMNVDEPMQILVCLVWEPFTYLYSGSFSQIQSILYNLFLTLQRVLCHTEGSLPGTGSCMFQF